MEQVSPDLRRKGLEALGQEKQHPSVGLLWEGRTGRDSQLQEEGEWAPGAGGSLRAQ